MRILRQRAGNARQQKRGDEDGLLVRPEAGFEALPGQDRDRRDEQRQLVIEQERRRQTGERGDERELPARVGLAPQRHDERRKRRQRRRDLHRVGEPVAAAQHLDRREHALHLGGIDEAAFQRRPRHRRLGEKGSPGRQPKRQGRNRRQRRRCRGKRRQRAPAPGEQQRQRREQRQLRLEAQQPEQRAGERRAAFQQADAAGEQAGGE